MSDIKHISRIHALSWKSAYKGIVPQPYLDDLQEGFWIAPFEDWIKSNVLTAQVAFDNGTPVGCVAYGKSREDTRPDWGEIVSIYLLPEYLGKGFGKELIQIALNDLEHAGFKNIYLWVLEKINQHKDFIRRMILTEQMINVYAKFQENSLLR